MNPGDGVTQNSDGSWTATVNGQQVYTGPDGQQAQNAFISNQPGGSNTSDPTQNYGFTTPTPGAEGYNPQYYSQAEQAIQDSINNAYNQELANTKSNELALSAAQQRAQDLMQYASANGDLALKAFSQVASTGMDIANLLTKMQGPQNAFAYDRAMNYLGNSGLGGSVGAVTGAARPAQFGLMGPTQPWDFSTMNEQLGNTQQGPNIIDSLLGLGNQAWTQYQNTTNNQLPFSLPQFNYNQNSQGTPSTPPATQAPAPSTAPAPAPAPAPTTPPPTNGPQVQPPGTIGDTQGPTQNTQQQNTLQNQTTLNRGPSYAAPGTTNTTNAPTTDTGPGFGLPPAPAPSTTNTGTPGASWTQNMLGAMGLNSSNNPGSWNNASYPGYSVAASQYLYGLPDPSQMNATNFFQLPKYSQDLMLSGYAAKGYSPDQLTEMWQAQLPGRAAGPSFGLSS